VNLSSIAFESDTLCIKDIPIISVSDIESCFTDSTVLDGKKAYALNIELTKSAAKLFKTVTEENVGKRIAMIIDNNVVMAPVLRDPVTNGRLTVSGESGPALKTLGEKLRKEMNGGF
jgi:preprotein translocase subunit SecD